jgi:hypothetical protein
MLTLKMMSNEDKPDFGHGKGFVLVQVAADETLRFYRDEGIAMVEIRGEDGPLQTYRPGGTTYIFQGNQLLDVFHGGTPRQYPTSED